MPIKKKKSAEDIVRLLRQVDVELSKGHSITDICRRLGLSAASYYKWRKSYGGLDVDQAKRLKALEQENSRLKRAVAELTLDHQILKDVSEGKY